MKKSYKLLFAIGLCALAFSFLLTVLIEVIDVYGWQEPWVQIIRMFAEDIRVLSLMMSVLLYLTASVNFFGSRYQKFTVNPARPAQLMAATAVIAVVALAVMVYLGIDHPWALPVGFSGIATVVLLLLIALFLRGTLAEGSEQWTMATIKRNIRKEARENFTKS